MRMFFLLLTTTVTMPLASSAAVGAEPKVTPNAPESLLKRWSAARASVYLDGAATVWLDKHGCAACHTHYPYLMAGPALSKKPTPGLIRIRAFLENRVAHWDDDKPGAAPETGSEGVTEVVATAATLAFHDSQTSGKLHPLTRKALERMWRLQQKDGAWDWNKHRLPPVEHDDYFGAVFAAVGVGAAPERYAESEAAQKGLARLRKYLRGNPAPDLHHRTWLLWASTRISGLMTDDERENTIKELRALQRADGGWSVSSLGKWKRLNGTPNDPRAPSDGYGTGLVVYVLRQAGVRPGDDTLRRAVHWLETNQGESGRYFTRSLNSDRGHYMTAAGTAFAAMAIKACATDGSP